MPATWQLRVERLSRYQLPLLRVRLNGWLVVQMVLSTGEPTTSIAPPVADQMQIGAAPRRGRRVIPSDMGPLIVRLARLQRMELQAIDGRWIDVTMPTLAVSYRSQALGVGGLLGNDVLAGFRRLAYEFGSPDLLVLEARE